MQPLFNTKTKFPLNQQTQKALQKTPYNNEAAIKMLSNLSTQKSEPSLSVGMQKQKSLSQDSQPQTLQKVSKEQPQMSLQKHKQPSKLDQKEKPVKQERHLHLQQSTLALFTQQLPKSEIGHHQGLQMMSQHDQSFSLNETWPSLPEQIFEDAIGLDPKQLFYKLNDKMGIRIEDFSNVSFTPHSDHFELKATDASPFENLSVKFYPFDLTVKVEAMSVDESVKDPKNVVKRTMDELTKMLGASGQDWTTVTT